MTSEAPLNTHIIRGLQDKLYDKRKAAALEVDRLVRDCAAVGDKDRIRQIIMFLINEFAYSLQPNSRNGGLIGLAAAAIALGSDVISFLDDIVPPVLACFSDQDTRVRYYACESMYNIAKIAKGQILRFFNEVFDALNKLAADSDPSVKNGAELLNNLIKDIVCEQSSAHFPASTTSSELVAQIGVTSSMVTSPRIFSLPRFIPLLAERVKTRNPYARHFLVQWLAVLESVPDIDLVSYLPEFFDGLLEFLSDKSAEVRAATSAVIEELLKEIKVAAEAKKKATADEANEEKKPPPILFSTATLSDATATPDDPNLGINWTPGQGVKVDYARIVTILESHLSSSEEETQLTAIRWINEFLVLAPDVMVSSTPRLIQAILPCIAHKSKALRGVANNLNAGLFQMIEALPKAEIIPANRPSSPPPPVRPISPTSPSYSSSVMQRVNNAENQSSAPQSPKLRKASTTGGPSISSISSMGGIRVPPPPKHSSRKSNDPFDYVAAVQALTVLFLHEQEETRIATLDWLIMLHKRAPNKILSIDDGTFSSLLKNLNDASDEVVKRDLQLLAQISTHSHESYFNRFMMNLLSLFSNDSKLLETRGSLIIRQLCLSLNPERIFRAFAEILEHDDDLEFASLMVQNLNIILITAPEAYDLRQKLKNLDGKDNQTLFTILYRSWCHNPVSTFALCLLAQMYEHASNLLQIFAELEITVNFLVQMDKLVQLLESPVDLRLQLLEPERYSHLYKCLYGVLMLLPQSSAFATLRNRLNSVSSLGLVLPASTVIPTTTTTTTKKSDDATMTSTAGGTTATTTVVKKPSAKSLMDPSKLTELVQHFKLIQARHEKLRNQGLVVQGYTRAAANAPVTSRSSSMTRRGRHASLERDPSDTRSRNRSIHALESSRESSAAASLMSPTSRTGRSGRSMLSSRK